MSNRDRELLAAAGLSIPEACRLFERSPQAVYQGLSQQERPYFSRDQAMALLHDAKQNDSPRIEGLIKFIEANYKQSESELILPGPLSFQQLTRATDKAERVILTCNGNLDHLQPTATFAKVLTALLGARRDRLDMLMPGDWVRGYVQQNLKLTLPNRIPAPREELAYLPCFLLTAIDSSHRAFIFGRLSAEELAPTEAMKIWEHFAPMCEDSAERKSPEVRTTAARR
jgi:hypothetical protein